jgi:aminopeptidase N
MKKLISIIFCVTCMHFAYAQEMDHFTHADTLRGSNTPQRAWWDVTFYNLHVKFNPADSTISGYNGITYRVLYPARQMQIDLMEPLLVDSMIQDRQSLTYRRDGNAFFVTMLKPQVKGAHNTITVYYHGKPQVAVRPPWDGGVTWARDSLGNVWIATTCQGIGASIWWPNKDIQSDEPDSQNIAITVPDTLMDVSNGRLRSKKNNHDGTVTYDWFVDDPINNYDVAANIGKYAHFSDVYYGEDGKLTLDYWPLPYHLQEAKEEFKQVKSMLKCYEYWFGPYPWYKDGYKLVETPYLGMEHQSCIGYGNHYHNGYLGRDLSGTGWGLKWDFIIIHESAHEWFGNSITSNDLADMWVHESFANYAESLYTECQFGKKAGEEYVIGCRKNVRNDRPIIAHFGVNQEGSEDMYYKGGNMLNTIRAIINNDEKWRGILRGLNKTFWHQTVNGTQIEHYISQHAGIALSKVFDQYLKTTMIPELEYKINGNELSYRWQNVVSGFNMPVEVTLKNDQYDFIYPGEKWKTIKIDLSSPDNFKVDNNFYVTVKNANS